MKDIKYFFNFYLNNENMTTFLSGKKAFSFGSSITSLYPTAYLELYLPSVVIESGLLSIGVDAKFEFFGASEEKKYTKNYKVWKIKCISQENTRSLSGIYSITFIHPWFFNQEVKSKGYYGSVELVLYNILLDEQLSTFRNVKIDKSKDNSSKHYRTYQTLGSFIEERLLNNYLVDNSPTFIYVDDNNEFHAHSFLTMLNNDKKNILIDTRTISESKEKLDISESLDRLIKPINLQYHLNTSGTLANRLSTKTSFLFFNHVSRSLDTLSENNSLFNKEGFYPVHNSLITEYPQSVYIDDSEDDSDKIYAKFLKKQIELLFDQSFSFICAPNFNIQVGEPIDVYLKKYEDYSLVDSDINSIFYATYLITDIKHIQINDDFITQIKVCRDIINSKSKDSKLQNREALQITS